MVFKQYRVSHRRREHFNIAVTYAAIIHLFLGELLDLKFFVVDFKNKTNNIKSTGFYCNAWIFSHY